jgi:hypothetical protein
MLRWRKSFTTESTESTETTESTEGDLQIERLDLFGIQPFFVEPKSNRRSLALLGTKS